MTSPLLKLNQEIIKCKKCARLVLFRNKIAKEKRKQFINETYWGKPITGYGDPKAQLLMIGLAPAAHGGKELNAAAVLKVCAALGKGCASTGWVGCVFNVHHWVAALYPEQAHPSVHFPRNIDSNQRLQLLPSHLLSDLL